MGARNESRANPAERAERQVRAYQLMLRGHSLRSAAEAMKAEGYQRVSHETVRKLVELESGERVTPLADAYRHLQLERLGEMRQAALAVLEREHVTVSHGRVVREGLPVIEFDDAGEPVAKIAPGQGEAIVDDAPVLAAIDRLVRIEQRTAQLLGLDAPQRAEIAATLDAKPAELIAKIEAARAEQAAREIRMRGSG